ncbi:MAG TPA: extracellular solute-binding protein [Anaerolineae bacterium]|nr:extracellular solute-binding protein [Anaerolineae bacterium]
MCLDNLQKIGRLALGCALICLLTVSLSGCKGAVPTPEPATIRFAYMNSDREYIEPLVEEFSKQYPHITVELRPTTMGELAWNFGAGDADVREVFTAIIDNQRERGDFLALDPFIEQDESFDLSDFYPAALETFTIEGKLWAVPCGMDSGVIYYNQDLFDQYGVPYPQVGWTWDDFVSTALALRDPEADVFGYANREGQWGVWLFVHQLGGRIVDDMQNPTRATFDDPLTIEALEWYGDLFHDYAVAPTPQQLRPSAGSILSAIVMGEVGMWSDWFEARGGDSDEIWDGMKWPMRWGMVTFPRATADTATDVVGDLWAHGYALSSQTLHPDAAWRLVAFLTAHASSRKIPARRSVVESEEYERQAGSEAVAVARAVLENGLPYPPREFINKTLEALGILGEAIVMVESGQRTAQEAMDWAQREADARIGP